MINSVFCFFFVLTLICLGCISQKISKASFPTGEEGLANYLDENFSWKQSQLTVEGKVYVKFVVQKDSNISDVSIMRSLCETCDLEAIRLVENMPKWVPATKANSPIKSEVVIPIEFSLKN